MGYDWISHRDRHRFRRHDEARFGGIEPGVRRAPLGIMTRKVAALALAFAAMGAPAFAADILTAYTQVDSDKCRHTKGTDVEDYGFWRCAGYGGIPVRLSAVDQRMYVSFGSRAADEPAAAQTFPAFNNMHKGTIEWRLERRPDGARRAFATILRWNVMIDEGSRVSRGRVLVVTRLGPGGVCHVGYVDVLANPDANVLARQIADEKARTFNCGKDKRIVAGKVGPTLSMPED